MKWEAWSVGLWGCCCVALDGDLPMLPTPAASLIGCGCLRTSATLGWHAREQSALCQTLRASTQVGGGGLLQFLMSGDGLLECLFLHIQNACMQTVR